MKKKKETVCLNTPEEFVTLYEKANRQLRKCSRCGKTEEKAEDISRVSVYGGFPFVVPFGVRLCRDCSKKLIMFLLEGKKR